MPDKIKLGVLFGGYSREREVSFAGGRTVYDNLDKDLFEPVPIFIDAFHNFIKLDWRYIYKGSIRDFYPSQIRDGEFNVYAESVYENGKVEAYAEETKKLGRKIPVEELSQHIDFAFLCLHGEGGEDGKIQGLLSFLQIPYSGSGVLSSALGIDKEVQKRWTGEQADDLHMMSIGREEVLKNTQDCVNKVSLSFDFPLVVRPAKQGSSIGVSIVKEKGELEKALKAAFFILDIDRANWENKSKLEKWTFVDQLCDLKSSLGFPLRLGESIIYKPSNLLRKLETEFRQNETIRLESLYTEQTALVESFIHGREFSCIVMRDEKDRVLALPPTEIVKGTEVYDYRSKYLPGLSRKLTPMPLSESETLRIRQKAIELFEYFNFQVYARIDGFYTEDGRIILNDPNTTSGMMPSSFFFHQAAEIGFTPSGFISYIVAQSIYERKKESLSPNLKLDELARRMQDALKSKGENNAVKEKVAIILGGYSSERHISLESGRNIFEKLSSSAAYLPSPIFLTKDDEGLRFYKLPMNLLLKDNADDISQSIGKSKPEWLESFRNELKPMVDYYQGSNLVAQSQEISIERLVEDYDFAFIALHGRPGEDGALQKMLDVFKMPYNGSGSESSELTIDKYKTLQLLSEQGFSTTKQMLVDKSKFLDSSTSVLDKIEMNFDYPLVAKPVDDGCSSAVKIVESRTVLTSFLNSAFRSTEQIENVDKEILGLKHKEEFPRKDTILIERLITAEGSDHFMEITGGFYTHFDEEGGLVFNIFEPSESIASKDVLSLEEKFLAGQGTNITPPRYHTDELTSSIIGIKVKQCFEKVARTLNVEGYARIDAFVRIHFPDKVEVIVIEVNSLPGMTPATAIFHQAAHAGLKPSEFIDKIIQFGINKRSLVYA